MSPVETQKIIWNKGFEEISLEDMFRNGAKFDLICNGDRHMVHVCLKGENHGCNQSQQE